MWTPAGPCPPDRRPPPFRALQLAFVAACCVMAVLYLRSLFMTSRAVHLVDFEVADMPKE
jgi:hypothetical protein